MAINLFMVGLSHKTAPVAVRERLAVPARNLGCCGCRLKVAGALDEVVVVSTCNRLEVYGASSRRLPAPERLFAALEGGELAAPHVYVKEGKAAVQHLFSVASGLDSMVLGETEITGQVKQAYQAAQQARLTGPVTNRLFQAALQTAKATRTQTGIGRGATSVGSVAVELAQQIFAQDLSDRSVLIIGAGQMGQTCVRHLAKKGAKAVLVANRSFERAEALASEFGGRALRFEALAWGLEQADIVVSSTGSPHAILRREDIALAMRARRNRPLFLIDIAVPRDVEPEVQELPNVYLYNVDHLEALVEQNVQMRSQELACCQAIIEERSIALMEKLTRTSGSSVQTQRALGWDGSHAASGGMAYAM